LFNAHMKLLDVVIS